MACLGGSILVIILFIALCYFCEKSHYSCLGRKREINKVTKTKNVINDANSRRKKEVKSGSRPAICLGDLEANIA